MQPRARDELRAKLEKAKQAAEQREQDAALEALQAQDVGYTSKLFVQALFPYRNPDSNERKITTAEGTISVYSPNGLPSVSTRASSWPTSSPVL